MIAPALGIIGNNYTTDTFSGDGATTDFALSTSSTTDNTFVFIDGVQQNPTDAYSVTNALLAFTEAPGTGASIVARYA
jgi:hypothetical protein